MDAVAHFVHLLIERFVGEEIAEAVSNRLIENARVCAHRKYDRLLSCKINASVRFCCYFLDIWTYPTVKHGLYNLKALLLVDRGLGHGLRVVRPLYLHGNHLGNINSKVESARLRRAQDRAES